MGKIAHGGQSIYHDLPVVANFCPFLCGVKVFLNAGEKLLLFPFAPSKVVRRFLRSLYLGNQAPENEALLLKLMGTNSAFAPSGPLGSLACYNCVVYKAEVYFTE